MDKHHSPILQKSERWWQERKLETYINALIVTIPISNKIYTTGQYNTVHLLWASFGWVNHSRSFYQSKELGLKKLSSADERLSGLAAGFQEPVGLLMFIGRTCSYQIYVSNTTLFRLSLLLCEAVEPMEQLISNHLVSGGMWSYLCNRSGVKKIPTNRIG